MDNLCSSAARPSSAFADLRIVRLDQPGRLMLASSVDA